jgi:hypothetical protein
VQLTEEDLKSGDHIYVRRKGILYSHHGIYAGEGSAFHFKGLEKEKINPVVKETGLDPFLQGGKLRRRDYKKRLPHPETLKIAKEELSNSGYSLGLNNCEHFVSYCATGKRKSKQIRKTVGGIIGVVIVTTGAIIRKKTLKNQEVKIY